jgi:integrase
LPRDHIPNLYSADRSDVIWEEAHVKRLLECESASAEIKWAARLAKLTGFRKSDLLKVSWNHVERYAIEIRTQKSSGKKSRAKRTATAPMTQELRALLDEIPKRATTILTSSRNRPWTADGFGSSWWKAMEDAGLHGDDMDLHLHDFRGTFATFIYRAGFTIREIADTLGWTEERIERLIDRYVKRDEIMKDRIRRLESIRATENSH